MIVRNEEPEIGRCLQSVAGVVDELIVVDTGSTDRTPEIAASYGARVSSHPWCDSFAEARNFALEQATGSWLFQADADEELTSQSRSRLRAVVREASADALLVNVRSHNGEGGLTEYSDSWQARLFRNAPGLRYEYEVHEQIIYSVFRQGGSMAASDLELCHYGYLRDTVQGDGDRVQRNLRLLESAVARQPDNAYLCAYLGLDSFNAGKVDQAVAALRRAILELDGRSLPTEVLHKVFLTLAKIGLAREDFETALGCARSSLELGGGDDYAHLMALKSAAYSHMGSAWSHIRSIRNAESTPDEGSSANSAQPARTHMAAVQRHLGQAAVYFDRMLQHPGLLPGERNQIRLASERLEKMLTAQTGLDAIQPGGCPAQAELWSAVCPI